MLRIISVLVLSVGFIGAGLAVSSSGTKVDEGLSIVGTLRDAATGLPIAGEVAVSFARDGRLVFSHAIAAKSGLYEVKSLTPGAVHLVTKAEGYASEHQTITLESERTEPVDFSIKKMKRITGTVRNKAGVKVPRATVRVVYNEEDTDSRSLSATYQWETGDVQTDADGVFSVGVHPDRPFVLEANHSEYVTKLSAPTRIPPDRKEEVVNLSLDPGVTVAGRVVDSQGNPVRGAKIRLLEQHNKRSENGYVSLGSLPEKVRFASSDFDGSFTFRQVAHTQKRLVVTHPDFAQSKKVLNLTAAETRSSDTIVLERQ